MKKTRTKIYVKASLETSEVVYTGIEFAEFIRYLPAPIENLMLLKGSFWGNRVEHHFELFEGQDSVSKLAKENIYSCGDFCFVDYSSVNAMSRLSEQQIAELLYMAHIGKPLTAPFFEQLQNRFAYLAHDDGWYCKLYCRDLNDFSSVLCGKIAKSIHMPLPLAIKNAQEQLLQKAVEGFLVDLDEVSHEKQGIGIKMYTIGPYEDMDKVLNGIQEQKDHATGISILHANRNEWTVV